MHSLDQVQKFLGKFYAQVGTPLALACKLQVDHGEWAALQERRLRDPSTYLSPREYFSDAQVIELTRKMLLPGDKEKRRSAAVTTFWQCEAENHRTNVRLGRFLPGSGRLEPTDLPILDFISRWRRAVKRVLGACRWNHEIRFSGGSTLSDAGKLTTIPDKMSSVLTAYPGLDLSMYWRTPMDPRVHGVDYVKANRFFTVPKDSDKDRGCCVEASAAIGLQLATGSEMKRKYKQRYKVDLRHAQRLHRRLAQQASCGELDLATVDLSNASDTVAELLVELLLPRDWWSWLNSLRAKFTEIDGKVVRLAKFSSMGNGFTFELETILFRTLCEALEIPEAYVFGDDIIITRSHSQDLLAALRFFGFTPNVKKTFCEGPFRESCGGDFFDGVPVRAHYLEEPPDAPQKWVSLHNGLVRMGLGRTSAAWFCVDQVPKTWRNFGPAWLGDLVFHDEDAAPTQRSWTTYEWEWDGSPHTVPRRIRVKHDPAPHYRVMRPISRKYDLGSYWRADVALAAASLGVPSSVTTRDDIVSWKPDYVCSWGIAEHPEWFLGDATVSVG